MNFNQGPGMVDIIFRGIHAHQPLRQRKRGSPFGAFTQTRPKKGKPKGKVDSR